MHSVRVRCIFEIKSFPSYQSSDSEIFIAGSFNGWNPKDQKFQFSKDLQGNFTLEVSLADNLYQYKITRGGWDKVECAADGTDVANRLVEVKSDTTISIHVEAWRDHFPAESLKKKSTADNNVHILDSSFWMPQLHRGRRIWIYLPQGYSSSKMRYPVLYMQDGQNVFDDSTSYSGEWGVDECLDSMKKKCIVVAIDNGLDKRLNEYCPYDFSLTGIAANNTSGKGEGKQYVDFLVKTLKPFIDKKFRTFRDKRNTFIAGSSMGGLISMYAVIKYPAVFGAAGVFSPAFWVGPKIFTDILKLGGKVHSKIYFYAGGKESKTMVSDMMKAKNEMKRISKPANNFISVVDNNAMHNESAWRKQFPLFYQWIMGGSLQHLRN